MTSLLTSINYVLINVYYGDVMKYDIMTSHTSHIIINDLIHWRCVCDVMTSSSRQSIKYEVIGLRRVYDVISLWRQNIIYHDVAIINVNNGRHRRHDVLFAWNINNDVIFWRHVRRDDVIFHDVTIINVKYDAILLCRVCYVITTLKLWNMTSFIDVMCNAMALYFLTL